MEKYLLHNTTLVKEEKTFLNDKKEAINYDDYSLLIQINDNAMQIKIDKNERKTFNTLIECGLLEKIK